MPRILRHFAFFMLLLLQWDGDLFGQIRLDFDHFSFDDGLPDDQVFCALTDRAGYLWLGTNDGLARFDGQNFKVFKHDVHNPQSICGNTVHHIAEDEKGNLWIAVLGGGLSYMDRRTGQCVNWLKDSPSHPLPTQALTCLMTQGPDTCWVGTMTRGLLLIDKKHHTSELFDIGKDKVATEPMAWNSVQGIIRDPGNPHVLWLAALGRGLVKFDTKTGTAISDTLIFPGLLEPNTPKPKGFQPENYKIETGIISPIGRTGSAANCVFGDKPGEIWIGSWSCGLIRVDLKTGKPQFFVPNEAEFLGGNPFQNIVTGIARKSKSELWIATLDKGLLVFDEEKRVFSGLIGKNMPDLKLNGLYSDPLGRLIVLSRNSGFYRVDNAAPRFAFNFSNSHCMDDEENREVVDFAFDAQEKSLWYAFQRCDYIFKKQADGAETAMPFLPPLFAAQLTFCLFHDGGSEIWAGGSYDLQGKGSLRRFNTVQNAFVPFYGFSEKEIMPPYLRIYEICKDRYGDLWLATEGGGLVKLNFKEKTIQSIKSEAFDAKNAFVSIAYDAKQDKIIAASVNSGLFAVDLSGSSVFALGGASLYNANITDMTLDASGNIYIASLGNGIFKIVADSLNKISVNYLKNQGLVDDKVLKLALDTKGNLFASTMKGLARWDKVRNKFQIFGKNDGLLDLQLQGKGLLVSPDGMVFIGQKKGFCAGKIADFSKQTDKYKIPVALTDFYILEKSILGDSLLQLPSKIVLNPDQNNWTVSFYSLDLRGSRQTRYAWKLEHYDKDWRYCDGCERATYTNLAGGNYQLQVRVVDEKGETISSNIATLDITVLPPFWATWWFLLAMAALLSLLIFQLFRWRLRLVQEKAEFKQKETELRARAIEMEMGAMRAQMNPHFIFNCLNSIHLFIVMNETRKAEEYLSKFSKLIRLVLDNSRADRIVLENELETIRFYLEMEQMRFEGRFNFEIRVDPHVESQSMEVPPMLIQPYVENAIWHGLLHKKGNDGYLSIDVEMADAEIDREMLRIRVEDNGIGREKSGELKSKSATVRKSHGMKITADRLVLIEQLYKINTRIAVEDLVYPDGTSAGTRVTIMIPV